MRITVRFSEISRRFNINFGEIMAVGERPHYTGSYTVIPKISEQTMETKGKVMGDNVLVEKIPYYEVSNTQNGTTAIIGGYEIGN